MSKTHTLLLSFVVLLSGPIAYAQSVMPSNVAQVTATLESGKPVVRWSAATDAKGVDYYRVYFSRKSILENGGDYDDFERTIGPALTYTFTKSPVTGPTLYVAVMAVNKDGLESEGFEAEAKVDLATAPAIATETTAGAPATSPNTVPTMPSVFTFDTALATSSTGLVLQFNKPLRGSPAPGPGYFVIIDSSGALLGLKTFRVIGNTIEIETQVQKPERMYSIGLLQKIFALDGTSVDVTTGQVKFLGFGIAPVPVITQVPTTVMSSSATSVTPIEQAPYVRNPALVQVQTVQSQEQTPYVRNPALPPVRIVGQRTQEYVGARTNAQANNLTNSGVGTLAVLLAAGASAGAWVRRRKKVVL